MNIPLKKYSDLLARYLKPQQKRVLWLSIALLSSIGLQLINPQILGYFIDTAVTHGASPTLLSAALLFIAVAFVTQIFAVTATYFGEQVAWSATNTLRVDLVEHCLNLDLSFHKSHTPGELVERVDGDVHTLSRFFSQFTLQVLGNLMASRVVPHRVRPHVFSLSSGCCPLAAERYDDWQRLSKFFTTPTFQSLVLRNGRIVAQGTFAALQATCVEMQML